MCGYFIIICLLLIAFTTHILTEAILSLFLHKMYNAHLPGEEILCNYGSFYPDYPGKEWDKFGL